MQVYCMRRDQEADMRGHGSPEEARRTWLFLQPNVSTVSGGGVAGEVRSHSRARGIDD